MFREVSAAGETMGSATVLLSLWHWSDGWEAVLLAVWRLDRLG
jgi:hypothetical protein